MANVLHSALTGSDLHESKGAASASSGQVAIANGAGSAVFGTLSYAQISGTPTLGTLAGLSVAPIANGGTGATDAATARSNLGAAANVGVTNGGDASAGVVGEVLTATSASAVSVTSATTTSVVSLSLTAGDWDVYGTFYVAASGASVTFMSGCLTTTSATTMEAFYKVQHTYTNTGSVFLQTPYRRLSLAATTTVYLTTLDSFSGGTVTSIGNIIARRAR